MKPICVPCQRFYRPKTNGYAFIEGMPLFSNAKPGTLEPEAWQPYKLWMGDLYECEGCGAQVIAGVGRVPVSEHFEDDFAQAVTSLGATFRVNDC